MVAPTGLYPQQHRTSTARCWTLEVKILKEALEYLRSKKASFGI
jgi:hypothetical protein